MWLRLSLQTLPEVTILGKIRQHMGWHNEVRRLGTHLLILVREGDMCFTTAMGRKILRAGDYLFLLCGCAYSVRSEGGCLYDFIHFDTAWPVELSPDASLDGQKVEDYAQGRDRSPYSLPASNYECLKLPVMGHLYGEREKVWLLLTECDMDRFEITPNRKLRIDIRFAQILTLLDGEKESGAPASGPGVLTQMLLYIHEHYMQPLTLMALAEHFGLSKQYVMRLFQTHLHLTVTQYITLLKLRHAMELLRYSTFRVNEVAEILGFGSAYYFCRLFKRQFGMTPTQFARSQLMVQ